MPPFSPDDFIQLSAVQHFAYCPRQCALIHLDMVWTENRATAEGRLLHEKADSGKSESRGSVKTVTGLLLRSLELGISGRADVVEFHTRDGIRHPFPVEYKRGRSKPSNEDRIQLCLQALCLEEMLGVCIPEGALFYGASRRRENVVFTDSLREETRQMVARTRELLSGTALPPPVNDSRCKGCSLHDDCDPAGYGNRGKASRYLESLRGTV